MDEANTIRTLRDVSCRNLRWFFDLCNEKNIEPQRLLRGVPYPLEHLNDPARFIDWESYTTLLTNLSKYFPDEYLLDEARRSWNHENMRVYWIVGRLLFTLKDQFLSAFGPLGIVPKHYPCETSVIEVYPGHLKIVVEMQPGCTPCHTFHLLLAGQMVGLPESLGYPRASVELTATPGGAIYDARFQTGSGILAPLRKAVMWPFTARAAARELTVTHASLLKKYRQIHQETIKLREAERLALESDSRYRLLATQVNDVIWTVGPDMKFRYLSPSIESLTGYDEHEVLAMNPQQLLTEEAHDKFMHIVKSRLDNPKGHDAATVEELELIHRNGSTVWAEVKTGIITSQQGEPDQVISVARDISERKAIERELLERRESYEAITTSAREAIISIDENYRITLANPATSHLFGYDDAELLGMDLRQLMPDLLPVESLPGHPGATTGVCKNKAQVPLEISFARHQLRGKQHYTGIIRNVTFRTRVEKERKALEQQLNASQKMESIGQLTGGIAHDFNNLLVAILGYAELGLKKLDDLDALNTYLHEIRKAGERAADLTHKLLAFSRRQIIEPNVVNVNDLINDLERMIARLLPENIEVRLATTDEGLNVLADKGQLEQVIINLAVNARDAMPRGGRLVISSELVIVDEDTARTNGVNNKGEHVLIRVTDNGVGMSDEVQQRLFEPFFTTKPEGRGTGLGLAVVFGIVKQHDGFIGIQSEVAEGTTIKVYLPVTDKAPGTQGKEPSPLSARGGNETLLVVEDDEQVRELADVILRGAGYSVMTAADGKEAMEIFRRNFRYIDLVIIDVVMPRMGGREVMTRIQAIRPDIRILFTSGYSESGIHANFILEEGFELVKKPYTTDGLRARVRKVLDQSAKGRSKAVAGRARVPTPI